MSILQHEYELSIWKDVWSAPTLYDDEGNVKAVSNSKNLVLDEEKSAVLATDDMDFRGRAINISFKVKLNGTHELTFDLPAKYVDETTGKIEKNYLRDLIDNETKIKLFFKQQWYTFYVKKVTEKREKGIMKYSYTCDDSYITELSRTGYKITFNEYSDHYIEQIHEFANDILDGSEWDYDEEKTRQLCNLKEYQEEKLVEYIVGNAGAYLYKLIDTDTELYATEKSNNRPIFVPKDTKLYGFYSEVNSIIYDTYGHGTGSTDTVSIRQILYIPKDLELDGNIIVNKDCNYIVKAVDLNSTQEEDETDEQKVYPEYEITTRYGSRLVYSPYTEYNKAVDRYVKKYKPLNRSEEEPEYYYSYSKTRILVPEMAINYAANSSDMTDTTGWTMGRANDKLTVEKIENGNFKIIDGIPVMTDEVGNNTFTPDTYGIVVQNNDEYDATSINDTYCEIINTGPYSRKLEITEPTTFACRLDYKWAIQGKLTNNNTPVDNKAKPTIKICIPIVGSSIDKKESYFDRIVTEQSALDENGDYQLREIARIENAESGKYYLIRFNDRVLAKGLLHKLNNIYIVIDILRADQSGKIAKKKAKKYAFCIKSLEFFEAWTYEGKHTLGNEYYNDPEATPYLAPIYTLRYSEEYDYIVPKYGNDEFKDVTDYINSLNDFEIKTVDETQSDEDNIIRPSQLYKKVIEQEKEWIRNIKGLNENDEPDPDKVNQMDYTLITQESFTSGNSFVEELFFYVPDNQPAFADPVVYYVDVEKIGEIYTLVSKEGPVVGSKLEQFFSNQKYRTLKKEKSNRFNLTQELSSLFQVYPVYEIDYYPNGKVKRKIYNDNDEEITTAANLGKATYIKRNKKLYYTDQKGGENKYGFKYGHNLNSISRTIDSNNIVTKMYVGDNNAQYATDGICTIARAKDNISKETYILNFTYLVKRGIVTQELLDEVLYSLSPLKKEPYTWEQFIKSGSKYAENCKNYGIVQTPEQGPSDYNFDPIIERGFLITMGDINGRYDILSEKRTTLLKNQLITLEAAYQTYTNGIANLKELIREQQELVNNYEQDQVSKLHAEASESLKRYESKEAIYTIKLEATKSLYVVYSDLYNRYSCEMNFLLGTKKVIEDKFNTKYESILKDGVWQDSKYLNDDAYFLDAEKVSYDSCGPKITYTIQVSDLSVLDKYAFADFNIGDITYVEDYEFFGDDTTGDSKFYNEKTLVAAITYDLCNPSKNSISLQNYSTKFDDLFQRVTASVQSLTFNENIYQRAANFTTTGSLNGDSLQSSLDENDVTLVGTQDVVIDGNGILVTDLKIPSNKVKIVGSGVFLTADGGNTWYGALENGGLNASLLTVGEINTKKIKVKNSSFNNFIWDQNGITAYATANSIDFSNIRRSKLSKNDKLKVIAHTYVRFNQYGLYFVDGTESAENKGINFELPEIEDSSQMSSEITNYLMDNANIAITYNGFSINGAGRKVRITSADGILMYNEHEEEVVRIGHIIPEDNTIRSFWGLQAKGALIEGNVYADAMAIRNISQGTETIKVRDTARVAIKNGRIRISRSIAEPEDTTNSEENEGIKIAELKQITSFGSTVFLGDSSSFITTTETNENEDETQSSPHITAEMLMEKVGSSIHIDKNGKFFSIGCEAEDGTYSSYFILNNGLYGDSSRIGEVRFIKPPVAPSFTSLSDIRLKDNIKVLDPKYLKLFSKLRVKTFTYKNSTSTHIGLIAQEVEEAMNKVGLTKTDLDALHTYPDNYSLDYIQLLSIAIAKIQQLEERIYYLEHKEDPEI